MRRSHRNETAVLTVLVDNPSGLLKDEIRKRTRLRNRQATIVLFDLMADDAVESVHSTIPDTLDGIAVDLPVYRIKEHGNGSTAAAG
jgi:hypothetical protein